jgi:hypothetical protein
MSDIRFNQWLHQSGTGGVTQLSTGHVGIGTTDPLIPVHAGNNAVLNVGVVTANSFYGSGANLTGITVPGSGTGLDLNDDVKIRIGTGNDLELYHSGGQSVITNSTGALIIQNTSSGNIFHQSNQSIVLSQLNNGNNKMAQFTYGGSAELYHNNVKKFETSNAGATVTGDLTTTGHVQIPDNFRLKVGSATNGDLVLIHDGTDSIIDNAAGNLFIRSNSLHLQSTSAENMVVGEANGAVELYFDNVKKFETNSDGVLVTRNTSDTTMSNTSHLVLRNVNNGSNTFAGIRFEVSSNTASDHFIVQKKHSGGSGTDLIVGHGSNERIRFVESGGITFHGDTAAANALDDYEEGSFTPQFGSSGSNMSFTTQQGSYTKVGNLVYVKGYIRINTINANGSGTVYIQNLPFANSSAGYAGLYINYTHGMNNVEITHTIIDPNVSHAALYQHPGPGNANMVNATVASAFSNNTELIFSGTYNTN